MRLCSSYVGLWDSWSCNGVTQCWPAQRGQAIVPGSSPYMVHEKWIQARASIGGNDGTVNGFSTDFPSVPSLFHT